MASPNLCLWLQSHSSLSLPSPGTSRAPAPCSRRCHDCERPSVRPSLLCVWLGSCCPHAHVTSTPHSAEAHLPSWSDIRTPPLWDTLSPSAWLSGWVRTWSWISWQHISLCMSVFLWDFFLPAPADPNSILLCRDCTCMWFQVSFPMRQLHGRRKNSVNCSWCLVSSTLKQRSYIKCWVFFLSEYLGTKPTQILIVHQISIRFFNVLHLMLSGLKLFARIPHQVQPFIFCFLWFLQTFVAPLLWEWKRGSKEKALQYSVEGNWFYAGIGDGRNSAEDRAQRDHFESWILLGC